MKRRCKSVAGFGGQVVEVLQFVVRVGSGATVRRPVNGVAGQNTASDGNHSSSNCLTALLTKSTGQNSCPGQSKGCRVLWNSNVHCTLNNSLQFLADIIQVKPVHHFPLLFGFSKILDQCRGLPSDSFPSGFCAKALCQFLCQNLVPDSLLCTKCHMPQPLSKRRPYFCPEPRIMNYEYTKLQRKFCVQ